MVWLTMEFDFIDDHHQRAKVFGGWLVKSVDPVAHIMDGGVVDGWDWRTAMCFVPDPKHEWEIK